MFWHKNAPPIQVEKITIPPKPTQDNYRRYSALMYASVAAISLAAMIALIGLKPIAYLVLKGKDPLPLLPEITALVNDCYDSYEACYDFPHFPQKPSLEYENNLNTIAKTNNINPILLTALTQAIDPRRIPDLEILKQVADSYSSNRQNHTKDSIPTILTTNFGDYRLSNINYSTYLAVLTLKNFITDKQAFNELVLRSPNDGKTNCLSEIIETIL